MLVLLQEASISFSGFKVRGNPILSQENSTRLYSQVGKFTRFDMLLLRAPHNVPRQARFYVALYAVRVAPP